ncbi:uncharacterized protein SCHCODRAFT_02734711, partial [Schizophyllum commune H4-8]|uniref:uncharacterized protein n=1 Tax=Schizophyllum commune (strain H4-8 / FGSC 9210) TaxID=578458 RepID=UPI00215E946A
SRLPCVYDSALYGQPILSSTYLSTSSSSSCTHLQVFECTHTSTRVASTHRSKYTRGRSHVPLVSMVSLGQVDNAHRGDRHRYLPSPLRHPQHVCHRSGRCWSDPPTAASARTLIRAPSRTAALANHEADKFELPRRSFFAQDSLPRLQLLPLPLRSRVRSTFSSFVGKRHLRRRGSRRLRDTRVLAHYPVHASNY